MFQKESAEQGAIASGEPLEQPRTNLDQRYHVRQDDHSWSVIDLRYGCAEKLGLDEATALALAAKLEAVYQRRRRDGMTGYRNRRRNRKHNRGRR